MRRKSAAAPVQDGCCSSTTNDSAADGGRRIFGARDQRPPPGAPPDRARAPGRPSAPSVPLVPVVLHQKQGWQGSCCLACTAMASSSRSPSSGVRESEPSSPVRRPMRDRKVGRPHSQQGTRIARSRDMWVTAPPRGVSTSMVGPDSLQAIRQLLSATSRSINPRASNRELLYYSAGGMPRNGWH